MWTKKKKLKLEIKNRAFLPLRSKLNPKRRYCAENTKVEDEREKLEAKLERIGDCGWERGKSRKTLKLIDANEMEGLRWRIRVLNWDWIVWLNSTEFFFFFERSIEFVVNKKMFGISNVLYERVYPFPTLNFLSQ